MDKKVQEFKVHVIYRDLNAQERRYALNKKLANIINLEENSCTPIQM